MPDQKICPDCGSEIPKTAAVCRHCGERVEGKVCPDCSARCPESAKKCRWCAHKFEQPQPGMDIDPFTVTAQFFPTFLVRGRLLCQTVSVDRDKILISTPGYFHLSVHEEEIPWNKVAGFDYRSGLIWDMVTIETRGQKASAVPCLSKRDGERLRNVLRRVKG